MAAALYLCARRRLRRGRDAPFGCTQTCPEKAELAEVARAPPSPRQENVIRQARTFAAHCALCAAAACVARRRARPPPPHLYLHPTPPCTCARATHRTHAAHTRHTRGTHTARLRRSSPLGSSTTSRARAWTHRCASARRSSRRARALGLSSVPAPRETRECACRRRRYFCTVTNKPVYIHPRSSLMAAHPEWIVRARPHRHRDWAHPVPRPLCVSGLGS
jgi:hypothetical protein